MRKDMEQGNFAIEKIVIVSDPRVAYYRMKKVRNHFEFALVEKEMQDKSHTPIVAMSNNVVKRALLGKYPITSVLATSQILFEFSDLLKDRADKILKSILLVSEHLFTEIIGFKANKCQMISAIVMLPRLNFSESLDRAKPCLILDDVRSADNIGVILRTAYTQGIDQIVCSEISYNSLNARSARVSTGALFHQLFYEVKCVTQFIAWIRSTHHVIGTSPKGTLEISSIKTKDLGNCWALVLGNEFYGSDNKVLKECDELVYIKQKQGDSLSVVAAASICLYVLATSFS